MMVDSEIGEYYRKLISYHRRSLFLQIPKHGCHITVIAGKYEQSPNKEFWRKYHHHEIEFEYSIDIGTDGCYFWLPVKCKRIEEIRVELGLPSTIPIPWHMTVGNLK